MEINHILNLTNHCLHLCNSSNFEEIVHSSLIDSDTFVTNNTEIWEKKFNKNEIKCLVKKPENVKSNEKIVVDGTSLGKDFKKWEKIWKKQTKTICIYNTDKLDPSILKDLVNIHEKMLLSINKIRMVSDKHLEKEIDDLNPEIVENLVKKDLKNIVLSFLLSKPMCGTDLVKNLFQKFKVFISPGMLYPTLHDLEKQGLLKYEIKLKNKIYSIQEEKHAKLLLKKHAKANSLISQFLVQNGVSK